MYVLRNAVATLMKVCATKPQAEKMREYADRSMHRKNSKQGDKS